MFDDLKFFSCQLALFIESGTIRSDELSFEISKNMAIGQYEPMLIPEAPGMPPEFPRLQINTSKGYQVTLSKLRADLVVNLPLGVEDVDLQRFFDEARKLLGILGGRDFRFSRIGYIHNYFWPSAAGAGVVAQSLLKVNRDNISDIQLSVTKKFDADGTTFNDLYSFANGSSNSWGEGYLVVRDVNNVPRDGLIFTADQVLALMNTARAKVAPNSIAEFMVE